MMIQAVALPLLGAFIGWVTNKLAIRSLFYPREPIRIPILKFELQGLLPRRRADLARDVGRIVEQDLLPLERILEKLQTDEMQREISATASELMIARMHESLPRFVPQSLIRVLEQAIRGISEREAPLILEKALTRIEEVMRREVRLGDVIEEQMRQYEICDLERIVTSVAARELRQIEWMGAALGFLIGLLQTLLVWLLP